MEPKSANHGPIGAASHGVDTLFPQVYKDLLRMAASKAREERQGHTLQPTAIVHEVYLRLNGSEMRWNDETEFRKYCAPVIRHVLVDYARSRLHNNALIMTCWKEMDALHDDGSDADVLALNEVLDRLGEA